MYWPQPRITTEVCTIQKNPAHFFQLLASFHSSLSEGNERLWILWLARTGCDRVAQFLLDNMFFPKGGEVFSAELVLIVLNFMWSVRKCIEKKITKQKKQPAAVWYTVNLNAADKTHSVYCSVSHSSGAALSDCEKRCRGLLQNLLLPACRLKWCKKALKQFERRESTPSWECCLHCGRGLRPSWYPSVVLTFQGLSTLTWPGGWLI